MISTLKQYLVTSLSKEVKTSLFQVVSRNPVIGFFIGIVFGRNLSALAQIYDTDKWGGHFYTPHYQRHFRNMRRNSVKLLEIGVGGYDDPKEGGRSLRMWKRYFPNGRIYSMDIVDKSPHEESRIRIFQGSQVDL